MSKKQDIVRVPIPTNKQVDRYVDAVASWGMKVEVLRQRLRWLTDNDWWEADAEGAGDPDRYDREVVSTLSSLLTVHMVLDVFKGARDPVTLCP